MNAPSLPSHRVEHISREFLITCTPQGKATWVDARAERILGIKKGMNLFDLAPPGADEKLQGLIHQGFRGDVEDWEVPLLVNGKPATASFSTTVHQGEVVLSGQLIPEIFTRAVAQLHEAMEEMVGLNRQIVSQKKELAKRNQEMEVLNKDLQESHQGVLTMHAELEDRAVELRHTVDVKSRVVSNVSHEFRTPLHSILGLTHLLAEGNDGALNPEQLKQVGFIRASAEELIHLVNDLLDLSKAEAGKANMRLEKFELGDFLQSMRGMLRPLLAHNEAVNLVVDAPDAPLLLETDKSKLSQILRNLVSNAIKFTERGEVHLSSHLEADGKLCIQVRDTGIGIAPEDLESIFEEFGQVDSPLQARVKGTGLGLPLSQRLTEMMGGSLRVESTPGQGSTFSVVIPALHAEVKELQEIMNRSRQKPAGPASILVVEDDRKTLFIYEKYLVMAGFHVLPARSVEEARAVIQKARPAAIVLDVMLEGETSWNFLAELKRDPETRDIPVLVVTVTNREQKARALGADEFWLKPIDQDRLLKRLKGIVKTGTTPRVLVIDDDEKARYIIRKHLVGSPYQLSEAASGPEGVAMAQAQAPHVILLDFLLKDVTAFDVLDELKADPRTRSIPVIIVTSHALDVVQKRRLLEEAEAVISKQNLSRELAINRIRDALSKVGVTTSNRP